MSFPKNIILEILYFLEWEEFYKILQHNNFNIQKNLKIYTKYNNSLNKLTINNVCNMKTEYLEVVKYLHQNLVSFTSEHGHSELVKYLYIIEAGCTTHTMNLASENGHLEIVKYLCSISIECPLSSIDIECSLSIIECAGINGHLEIIKYIFENQIKTHLNFKHYIHNAINRACLHGHLEIVKYLHSIGGICTTYAMYWASMSGHLEIIKYLHENFKKVFNKATTDTMDLASQFGHLEVVKYLHDNGKKHSLGAMNTASQNGHLEVVQYLYCIRGTGCTNYAMVEARQNGHLEVIKYLHSIGVRSSRRTTVYHHYSTRSWIFNNCEYFT
jgi:hypothetical protein